MFNTKKTRLFDPTQKITKKKVSSVTPTFISAARKATNETRSGNGALKLASTLDPFVDQFGQISTYKAPRTFSAIEKDCEKLWAECELDAVKFAAYLRTIPRKVQYLDGSTTEDPQLGGELKHEPIMRMIWLSQKAPDTFWKNIGLFVSLGSWHDVFTMLQYDLVYNGWENRKLDWNNFGKFILYALQNKATNNLVKKYLPQIKARSACKTVESQANCMIAKWLCSLLFGEKVNSTNYKQYRVLKTSGNAHDWQKLISKGRFNEIDFDKIHGRALNLLVRSKFLKNQGLSEKYKEWIGDPKTVVKYTGFVHELFQNLPKNLSGLDETQRETINKQFQTLVDKAKSERKPNSTSFIVARDISSSMKSAAVGLKMSSFEVAKALALYFSEFLTGTFANSYLTFESQVATHQWKGNSPLEKWYNDGTNPFGSTNFQSVIDLFVRLKREGVGEADFPTGIICISDGDFNATHCGKTNVDAAKDKLIKAGFSKSFVDTFVIVLWNIPNTYYSRPHAQFETTAQDTGAYYFSGFSGSVIQLITGSEVLTPKQIFDKAMDQEVLSKISL